MKDGERLRQFIENQPKSKISIARDLNISKQTLFQYFKSKELSKEVKDRFEQYFGKKVFREVSMTDTDQKQEPEESGAVSTPVVIQVILNLSYIGKKNADSMDKMAATNQRNTEIIAALVASNLPNSKFAQQLTASLAGSQQDVDVPSIEEMLGPEGTELLKRQWQAGKTKEVNK